jgi:hypothetical protein
LAWLASLGGTSWTLDFASHEGKVAKESGRFSIVQVWRRTSPRRHPEWDHRFSSVCSFSTTVTATTAEEAMDQRPPSGERRAFLRGDIFRRRHGSGFGAGCWTLVFLLGLSHALLFDASGERRGGFHDVRFPARARARGFGTGTSGCRKATIRTVPPRLAASPLLHHQ